MTKSNFINLLRSHDWTWRYADDPKWYNSGRESERKIESAIRKNPEFKETLEQFKKGEIS